MHILILTVKRLQSNSSFLYSSTMKLVAIPHALFTHFHLPKLVAVLSYAQSVPHGRGDTCDNSISLHDRYIQVKDDIWQVKWHAT